MITFLSNFAAQRIVKRFEFHGPAATDGRAAISLKATGRSRRRLLVNRAAEGSARLAAVIAIAALAIVVWSVGSRGAGALNLDFFTKGPPLFGQAGGGIAPALAGRCCSSSWPRRSRCRSAC